jgi:hypothetical protein
VGGSLVWMWVRSSHGLPPLARTELRSRAATAEPDPSAQVDRTAEQA